MKKQAVIFMSGYGSNAEALLDYSIRNSDANFEVAAIFTDRPATSRAYEIAGKYNLEVIEDDIFAFYAAYGEDVINLATPRRMEIRNFWTKRVSEKLKSLNKKIDFILLAGFEPLINITEEYVTLNVHPCDLTFEINGERVLNGLGVKPVEYAISLGHTSLRSSVIIAQQFEGKNTDIDAGVILGISEPMMIDFGGFTQEELQQIYRNRPAKLPKGYTDDLREVAKKNIEKLKYCGDHVVFPQAADDFASGKFKVDEKGQLFYWKDQKFVPVKTVEYHVDGYNKLIL